VTVADGGIEAAIAEVFGITRHVDTQRDARV
jgi:hypothetical protein